MPKRKSPRRKKFPNFFHGSGCSTVSCLCGMNSRKNPSVTIPIDVDGDYSTEYTNGDFIPFEALSIIENQLLPNDELTEDDIDQLKEEEACPSQGTIKGTVAILPNAKCTCNSGKKYKKCCGKLRI